MSVTLLPAGASAPPHPALEPRPVGPLSPDALAVISAGLARTAPAASLAWRRNGDRRFARLLWTPRYEAWLIAWSPSSGLDLHDHGGSVGSVWVAEGELVEAYTDLVEPSPISTRRFAAGEGFAIPATRIHEVYNDGPDEALSVHVYSAPLEKMTFYDHRPEHFLDVLHTASGPDLVHR